MSDKEAERVKRRLHYKLAVKLQRRPGYPTQTTPAISKPWLGARSQ